MHVEAPYTIHIQVKGRIFCLSSAKENDTEKYSPAKNVKVEMFERDLRMFF